MTLDDVKGLRVGDEVFWEDPDDGACSRAYKIASITYVDEGDDDPMVRISSADGCFLACYASELREGTV